MTVIIGMNGFPGVVLAADSEETISGYSKRQVDKVAQWKNDCIRFAIGGAGAGHYADMLADKIAAALMPFNHPEPNAETIEGILERVLVEFHQTHIWPRASSQSAEDAAVQLIIVIQPLVGGYAEHGFIWVWRTCDSAVTEIGDRHYRSHASIGIGSHLAEYLLDHLFAPSGGEAHMVLTAGYVMRETGKSIAQVGKDPYITIFRTDGTVEYFYESELRMFDAFFEKYDRFVNWASHYLSDAGPTRRSDFTDERMADYMIEVKQEAEERWQERLRRRRAFRDRMKGAGGA